MSMIEHGSPPLPRRPAGSSDAGGAGAAGSLPRRSIGRDLALVLALPGVSVGATGCFLLGLTADTGARTSSGDVDIDAALGVLGVSAVAGVVVWAIGTWLAIRALFPVGTRADTLGAVVVAGLLATIVLVPAGLTAVGPDWLKIGAILLPQPIMSAVMLFRDRRLRRPRSRDAW